MTKKILIDATHKEESRAAIVDGHLLEDYELETVTKKEIRSNIYLAKVIRVEPSLQAAFVDYGAGRHGFLPFAEIHPDYFQIPVEDKKALLASGGSSEEPEGEDDVETFAEDDDGISDRALEERRKQLIKKYKIQDVVHAGQILLIQIEKDERGNKGAAITTYISLAGQHSVLMPNSNKRVRFGVSRKIPYGDARKQIKDILKELPVPEGMTIIARTSAVGKSKEEMLKDYDYMMDLWNEIKKKTYASSAPALIHDDGNLVKRAIRDMYKDDIDEILIEGGDGYKEAYTFAKSIGFDGIKKIKQYADPVPLFIEYKIEDQLESIGSPIVKLPSGGYIVINPTEALTAIDVNSGKSTKERDIEGTALKTNLEAAVEVGRQLRLRDMGGLIVVDFIDMVEPKHNQQVEERMRHAIKRDRAKIQTAKLSQFGLMEVSRQRLRPSVLEVSHKPCPFCGGTGLVPSVQTASLNLLRRIEETLVARRSQRLYVAAHPDVALYTLNQKRDDIAEIESRYNASIIINGDETLINEKAFVIDRLNLDTKLDSYLKESAAPGSVKKTPPQRAAATELMKKAPAPKTARVKPVAEEREKPAPSGGRSSANKKGILSKVFGAKKK